MWCYWIIYHIYFLFYYFALYINICMLVHWPSWRIAQNNEIKDAKYDNVDGEQTYRNRVEASIRTSKANEWNEYNIIKYHLTVLQRSHCTIFDKCTAWYISLLDIVYVYAYKMYILKKTQVKGKYWVTRHFVLNQ